MPSRRTDSAEDGPTAAGAVLCVYLEQEERQENTEEVATVNMSYAHCKLNCKHCLSASRPTRLYLPLPPLPVCLLTFQQASVIVQRTCTLDFYFRLSIFYSILVSIMCRISFSTFYISSKPVKR